MTLLLSHGISGAKMRGIKKMEDVGQLRSIIEEIYRKNIFTGGGLYDTRNKKSETLAFNS
jgi:hypothetical protein